MDALVDARRKLQSAAMIAHLPRAVVEEYDRLALAALQSSRESETGSVSGLVTECVDAAYKIICDLLWSPFLARLAYPFRLRQLRKLVATNKELEGGQNLRWRYQKP